MTTTKLARFRVISALVQLRSMPPGPATATPIRHFYRGDLLPIWLDPDEQQHLLDLAAIEVVVQ